MSAVAGSIKREGSAGRLACDDIQARSAERMRRRVLTSPIRCRWLTELAC